MKFSGILGRGRSGQGPRREIIPWDPRIRPSFPAKSEIAYLFLRLQKPLSTNFVLPQISLTLVNFYAGIPTHTDLVNRSI